MRVEVDGINEVEELLKKLHDKTSNLRPYLAGIGQIIRNSIEDSFENEKTPAGRDWTPLNPKTISTKGHSKKLWKSGRLQGSIHSTITESSVTVGVNAKSKNFLYPVAHQFGTKYIPAREFLPLEADGALTPSVHDEIIEFLKEELELF